MARPFRGSEWWTPALEQPNGDFGFVWGCIWGDDSSWKVQYLDLRRVTEGVIKREERFGYLELAVARFRSAVLDPQSTTADSPPFMAAARDAPNRASFFLGEMRSMKK